MRVHPAYNICCSNYLPLSDKQKIKCRWIWRVAKTRQKYRFRIIRFLDFSIGLCDNRHTYTMSHWQRMQRLKVNDLRWQWHSMNIFIYFFVKISIIMCTGTKRKQYQRAFCFFIFLAFSHFRRCVNYWKETHIFQYTTALVSQRSSSSRVWRQWKRLKKCTNS